jgi:hypothetical protein
MLNNFATHRFLVLFFSENMYVDVLDSAKKMQVFENYTVRIFILYIKEGRILLNSDIIF